ncbi:MAG: Tetratricopeptide repeat-containing protein [Verrucomicrobiales bacterium]|nr:Tetratricopeptide repeat-containing protein [Verrucomicrobiales bacterium]
MISDPANDPPDFRRLRQEVEGYLELDLPDMAEEALDAVPGQFADNVLIMEGKLALRMHLKQWSEAVECGLKGCAEAPGHSSFFIHSAYCLHELGRTEEAHLLLISGPGTLQREPLFHYNMGCYLCVLGRRDEAVGYLQQAFRLDSALRAFAAADKDLQKVRDLL